MSKSAVLAATKLKQSLKDPEKMSEYASIQRHICFKTLSLSRDGASAVWTEHAYSATESVAHASSKVDGVP